MHLVGFIIRIYPDARSPERQITVDSAHWDLYGWYKELVTCRFYSRLHMSPVFSNYVSHYFFTTER